MGIRSDLEADLSTLEQGLLAIDENSEPEKARRIATAYRKVKRQLDLITSNPAEYDPDSDEFKARIDPSRGFLSNVAAGAGKALYDLPRGIAQLGAESLAAIPGISKGFPGAVPQLQADRLRAEQSQVAQRDAPLMGTGGGLTGNIGANVGLAFAPGGIAGAAGRGGAMANSARAFSNPQTLAAAGISGAVQGGIAPVTEDQSRTLNTVIGGGAGVLGSAITRPFQRQANAAQQRAIDLLASKGVPMDVAERTQNAAAHRLGAMLDDSLITAGGRQNLREAQNRAFTRAVLETIGENADEATPAVLNSARLRLGDVFEDVAGGAGGVRADFNFINRAAAVYRNAQNSLLDDEFRLFERNFENVMGAIDNGIINPDRFNAAIRQLSKLSPRPGVGQAAAELQDALLDTLERTAPQQQDVPRAARSQWRNMRIIQGVIDKGEDRFISPLRLSNTLSTKRNQNLSVFGLGADDSLELSALARAGREVLKDMPNSGTPMRQQVPTGVALGSAFGMGGVPGAAAAAGGIYGTGRAFNSQGILGDLLVDGLPDYLRAPLIQSGISGSRNR